MRRLYFLSLLLASSFTVFSQDNVTKYNKELADSLGADDYGMKMYVFVILKTGPNTLDKKMTDSLFKGHMENMGKMVSSGKLVVAGPMGKNNLNYRGIFILNSSLEDASTLLLSDPAIKAGLLATDIFPWYGSAALPKYLPYHDLVQKKEM